MKTYLSRMITLLLLGVVPSLYGQEFEAQSEPLRINLNRDTNPPDVFMISKNGGRLNSNGKVESEVRVFDASGIKNVKINGIEKMHGNLGDSVKFNVEFFDNEEVMVYAQDYFNNVKERPFTVKAQSATDEKKNRRYVALILAVEDYSDPGFAQLTEPVKDATLLKNVLTKKYGFEESNITFLKNPKYEDLDAAFDDLMFKVSGEDLLLIFYAGHGKFEDKTQIGYWLPADASQTSKSRWFRNSRLVEDIGAINSKHTLLIADACFSGGIFKTRSALNNASAEYSTQMKHNSRKAMTSGQLTTVPDKSVFMKYLLKALEENENKFFSTEDLYDYIKAAMKNNSTTKPEYGEIKNTGDEGGTFVFMQNN